MQKIFIISLIALTLIIAPSCFSVSEQTNQVKAPIGINLASIDYYSPQLIFVDGMKSASEWTTSNSNLQGSWDTQAIDSIPKDRNGYPLYLPYNVPGKGPQIVKATTYWDLEGHYPSGNYTVFYDGDGDLSFLGPITVNSHTNGRYDLTINSSQGGVILLITRSTRGNNLRNIRFIMPGFENNYNSQTFNPEFLQAIEDFSLIRFMDLQKTNFNPVTTWNNRTTKNTYTQSTSKGIAAEYIIELANTANKDVWINIPHKADDNYVRNLARMLNNDLDEDKKVYIEYSNEVWNGVFSQTFWIQQQACQRNSNTFVPSMTSNDGGIAGCEDLLAGVNYQAKRSARIFQIFKEEFSDDSRLVNVVASQTSNTWLFDRIFEAFNNPSLNPTGIKPNAIAIAPYFGASIPQDIVENNEVETITVDEILNRAEQDITTNVNSWMLDMSALARRNNVTLLAYEGGQHIVGINGNQNNDLLTQKIIEANRNARMKELYNTYLTEWYQAGGNTFVHFSSIVKPTKWGAWGLLEYLNQPIEEAPKYQAIKEFRFVFNNSEEEINEAVPVNNEPPVQNITQNTTNTPGIQNDLVAYWNFDNNVLDQSGNNFNLQNHNVNCNVAGKINQGCYIGNNAESLDIKPYPLSQDQQAFSFATFVKFDGNVGEKNVLEMGFESFGLKYMGHGQFHCMLRNSTGSFLFSHESNFYPDPGKWYHVACTYNPQDKVLRFYVDGNLNETLYVPTFDRFGDAPQSGMGIGCRLPGFCQSPVPGWPIESITLDETRLYSKTLTLQEIQQLAQA